MIQPIKTNIRYVGFNREIRDAMELCNLDVQSLAALLDKDERKCRAELLDQEMITLRKMSWLARIFNRNFRSLNEWRAYISKMIEERGPAWLEEPPLIEGSSRYYHQLYEQFRPDRKREAADE